MEDPEGAEEAGLWALLAHGAEESCVWVWVGAGAGACDRAQAQVFVFL